MRILQVRKLQIRGGFPRLCNLILLFINQPESAPPGTLSAGVITRGESCRRRFSSERPKAATCLAPASATSSKKRRAERCIFSPPSCTTRTKFICRVWRVEERDETVLTLSRLTNFAFLINTSSTGKAETQKNKPRFAEKRD
jgi:hypothetical protein